jgi:uroporphyrinogen III methyltransferase/synthase
MVYIVGAGPGDPGLLTVRGAECLAHAEVVVADRLVAQRQLDRAPKGAELIVRGPRRSDLTQEEINQILVERARSGKVVVRLKGGDPFLFGRGGEEAEALQRAGLSFEIVPGVTAALAAPAYAGIPLTHRGVASSVIFAAGHESDDKSEGHLDWRTLADPSATVVLYMSLMRLAEVTARLVTSGRAPETPAAVIADGTLPSQKTIVGTLSDLAERAKSAHLRPPALVVVGEVVRLAPSLSWFAARPLHGARVLVTRAAGAAEPTVARLEALGAEVVSAPAIEMAPPEDPGPIEAAIAGIGRYTLIAFVSVNAVDAFFARLESVKLDARVMAGKVVAAVGERTANALAAHGIHADVISPIATAEGLADTLGDPEVEELVGKGPALLPRAAEGRDALERILAARGILVDAPSAYRSLIVPPARLAFAVDLLQRNWLDAVTFGSPRTVQALLEALPDRRLLEQVVVGAVGPTTAQALSAAGVRVDVVPGTHTFDSLVRALVAPVRARLAARLSL